VHRRTFVATLVAAVSGRRLAAQAGNEPRYPGVGPGHFVRERREGGRVLVLEDKSLWEVAERNRFQAAEWQELEGISVRFADGEPPFSYELTNVDRDEGIAARWVRPQP
jgi:hypothetical protein